MRPGTSRREIRIRSRSMSRSMRRIEPRSPTAAPCAIAPIRGRRTTRSRSCFPWPARGAVHLEASAVSGMEVELRWRDNSAGRRSSPSSCRGRATRSCGRSARCRRTRRPWSSTNSCRASPTASPWRRGTGEFARSVREGRGDHLDRGHGPMRGRRGLVPRRLPGGGRVGRGKGRMGQGVAERLTADAGDFWFFPSGHIELVVKVLDGCAINDHLLGLCRRPHGCRRDDDGARPP